MSLSQEATSNTRSSGTEGSLTLQQIMMKSEAEAKSRKETCELSRPDRPNTIPASGTQNAGGMFTEEMLTEAPFAVPFITRPKDPLKNKHCFYCIICQQKVKMVSKGIPELRRQFKREHHRESINDIAKNFSFAQSLAKKLK